MKHLRGQYVNLKINPAGGSTAVVAASTNCSIDIKANTADGSAKDDPGEGLFDNPEFINYSYSISNESFLVDISYLGILLDKVINGDATVQFSFGNNRSYGDRFGKEGVAIISNLSVESQCDSFVKVNLSLEGTGRLTDANVTVLSDLLKPRIKGKSLMVAIYDNSKWRTIACSKNHKLNVNCNISDVSDKDSDDCFVTKEVTGKSVSLTTENMVATTETANDATGMSSEQLSRLLQNGTTVNILFGYYAKSIGQSIHGIREKTEGWGEPDSLLLRGDFMVTSLSYSGAVKDYVSYSAEFQNKGIVTAGGSLSSVSLSE